MPWLCWERFFSMLCMNKGSSLDLDFDIWQLCYDLDYGYVYICRCVCMSCLTGSSWIMIINAKFYMYIYVCVCMLLSDKTMIIIC